MTQAEEKENIISLPLQERTIAIALKHIFDQIKVLQNEENQLVQKVHNQFITKFKEIQSKSSKVIQGQPITQDLLKDTEQYFNEVERSKVKNIVGKGKKLSSYWLTTLTYFYKEQLSTSDKDIARVIKDISTDVDKDSLKISIQIDENQWLSAGKIVRKFILNEGIPQKVEGVHANWKKDNNEGLLGILLSQVTSPEQLNGAFGLATEFINELVPYSLQYYLGIATLQSDDQYQQQEQQEDEQQFENEPGKKIKQ